MNRSAIKIGSYTLAMRGCELIRRNGMNCEVRRISDCNGTYGCMFAIYVNSEQLWRAESILRSSGIMIIP